MLNVPDTEIKEGKFNLLLDNFEGPIDLLLVLARSQKVDLSDISISELADQYINFINQYRNIHVSRLSKYIVSEVVCHNSDFRKTKSWLDG